MNTRPRKMACAVVLGVAAVALAACGESPQVIQYKAGKYQGKPDTRPWESAPYSGDKTRWESDIHARTDKQTELKRIPQ